MNNFCPKVEKCPIFINNVLTVENAAIAYKALYCEAGAIKYSKCRRFEISEMVGKCPPEIMPNCQKTKEEIIQEMKEKALIK